MYKELIIDGVTYIPKTNESTLKIVILQRGWCMVGIFNCVGQDCTLSNAYVIRQWGTKTGLGQLALEGKQENTILDPVGLVQFDYLTVVALIDCDKTKWKGIF